MEVHGVLKQILFLMPAVALTLAAQGPITDRLEVEFTQPVMVGDQRLEPGKYTIRQLPSQNNPRILEFSTDRGTNIQATAAAAPVMTNRNTKETSVILEQRGSDYHVRQVWLAGRNYGYEFLPIDGSAGALRVTTGTVTPPRTIRLAATYTPGTQTTETTASRTTTETTERAAQTPAPQNPQAPETPTPQTPAPQPTEEQQRAEQERMAREQAERERADRERAEQERLARERAEQERAEQERMAQQRAEQERMDRERAERERADRERAEQDRMAQERAQREPVQTAQRTTPAMPGTSSAFPSVALGGLLIAGAGLLLHRFHGRM